MILNWSTFNFVRLFLSRTRSRPRYDRSSLRYSGDSRSSSLSDVEAWKDSCRTDRVWM